MDTEQKPLLDLMGQTVTIPDTMKDVMLVTSYYSYNMFGEIISRTKLSYLEAHETLVKTIFDFCATHRAIKNWEKFFAKKEFETFGCTDYEDYMIQWCNHQIFKP